MNFTAHGQLANKVIDRMVAYGVGSWADSYSFTHVTCAGRSSQTDAGSIVHRCHSDASVEMLCRCSSRLHSLMT